MKLQFDITKKVGTSTFKLVTGAILLTANVSLHALEVRTSDHEVWGTEQIESGKIDEGIRILESNVNDPTGRTDRAAYLTNLCAAYILKGELETAREYCDRGVRMQASARDSYNNRAVLNVLQGNLDDAVKDLAKAGPKDNRKHDSVGSVAYRNMVQVQAAIAAQDPKNDTLVTDNSSQ